MGMPGPSGAIVTGPLGTSMRLGQIVDAVVNTRPLQTIVSPGITAAVSFTEFGDNAFRLLLDQDCALSVSGGVSGKVQLMRLFVQQPSGGDCVLSWPDNIQWVSGAPFVDSRIGAVLCVEIMWDGLATYYGRLIYG